MNSAFWSGLIEAIVACFFLCGERADMKGMMPVQVKNGICSFGGRLACVRVRFLYFVHSCVIHSDGPLRLKGQPCCRAIKICRSVSTVVAASPAWHYKCAILRGKCPPSPRCDHTSLLGGLCWLTGVSAKYGTDMISWPRDPHHHPSHSLSLCVPLCLSVQCCGISLHHSSPSLSSWNFICIMLFVFAEITDPGTKPWLRCIKKCSAHSQCSWLNTSRVCCLSNASVLHINISCMPSICWAELQYSLLGWYKEGGKWVFSLLVFSSSCSLITCKIPEVGGCWEALPVL